MPHSDHIARVAEDPRYQHLIERRGRYTWTLTLIMLTGYFGYILLIAFNREFLGRPIGNLTITIGIPLGLGVILLAIVLTGLYVRRANREFDAEVAALALAEDGE